MEVDFLPNKKDGDEKKEKSREEGEIEWTKPEIAWTKPIDEKASQATKEADERKVDSSEAIKPASGRGFFNFFKRKEKDGLTDKNKLKKSRKEILEFIDKEKKMGPAVAEADKDKGNNILSWLNNLFRKEPKKKEEVLVDYQKALKEEQRGKGSFSRETTKEIKPETGSKKEKSTDVTSFASADAPADAKALADEKAMADKEKENREKTVQADRGIPKESSPKEEEKTAGDSEKLKEKEEKPGEEQKKDKEELTGDSSRAMDTNLIKDEIIVFFEWKKNILLFLIPFIVACLLVAGAYGGLSWWSGKQEVQIQDMNKKFEELERKIKQTEDSMEEIFAFKKKLKLASALLDQHIYWTNFFNFLEDNTLPSVYYLNFSGDDKGSYVLPAIANNFSDIEDQVRQMLKSDSVIEVEVNQGTVTIGEATPEGKIEAGMVNFGLSLSLDPAIFNK